jgi:hypothetical protein
MPETSYVVKNWATEQGVDLNLGYRLSQIWANTWLAQVSSSC